jgi:hypothetical protein
MVEDRDGATTVREGRRTVNENTNQTMREGDIVELTLNGERHTAEVMLVTMDDVVLLDLFDGDRPAWARLASLQDVEIFRPDAAEILVAA